jgi:muramidase (phage lysozyme)
MVAWPWCAGAVCGLFTATNLYAGALSLFETGRARGALIAPSEAIGRGQATEPSSLFIGREGASLFAVPPKVERVSLEPRSREVREDAVTIIRQIIEQAESRRDGYDAVQHGARVKPPRVPTQMSVAEIYAWIASTPGQPHAIGRYQFIPVTLRRVMKKIGASPQQRFSPQLQDQLADVLLAEAGFHDIKAGKLSRREFMNNLAKIWAGLPNDTGRSHYDGHAGNKASMTWAKFDVQMARAFAQK